MGVIRGCDAAQEGRYRGGKGSLFGAVVVGN